MIQKTKDYEMFKFRGDNRASIDQSHVKKIMESIQAKNLLELRPIDVNKDFEVIDGQHRLIAAKNLGVEIYYKIDESLEGSDIILMNISKAWKATDYLNYFCKNGHIEYQKLDEFMKKNRLSIRIALNLIVGESYEKSHEFKMGKFIFGEEDFSDSLALCWETVDYIKKMNGHSSYVISSRFWKALVRLFKHPDFDRDKWKTNMTRMIERFGPRATFNDFCRMITEVYNWKNLHKINLMEYQDKTES